MNAPHPICSCWPAPQGVWLNRPGPWHHNRRCELRDWPPTKPPRCSEAIAELRHLTTCHCDPPWAARGMHMPDCAAEYRDDLELLIAAAEQDRARIERVRILLRSAGDPGWVTASAVREALNVPGADR